MLRARFQRLRLIRLFQHMLRASHINIRVSPLTKVRKLFVNRSENHSLIPEKEKKFKNPNTLDFHSPIPSPSTQSQIHLSAMENSNDGEVAKIFSKFNKNSDGKISAAQISELLVELRCATTRLEEIRRVMDDIDKDKDGYIDLHELTEFLRHHEEEELIREAFDTYDLDGNGLISASDLHPMLNGLWGREEYLTLEECAAMIKSVTGGDGNLSFAEFKKMMTRSRA